MLQTLTCSSCGQSWRITLPEDAEIGTEVPWECANCAYKASTDKLEDAEDRTIRSFRFMVQIDPSNSRFKLVLDEHTYYLPRGEARRLATAIQALLEREKE